MRGCTAVFKSPSPIAHLSIYTSAHANYSHVHVHILLVYIVLARFHSLSLLIAILPCCIIVLHCASITTSASHCRTVQRAFHRTSERSFPEKVHAFSATLPARVVPRRIKHFTTTTLLSFRLCTTCDYETETKARHISSRRRGGGLIPKHWRAREYRSFVDEMKKKKNYRDNVLIFCIRLTRLLISVWSVRRNACPRGLRSSCSAAATSTWSMSVYGSQVTQVVFGGVRESAASVW